ncbi:MAG TPA: site-specific integrase [Candidatus Thermoplasmatota archaeon]|nr:site-specific integrase [Candidatus Thermoplasmatota archaeon]
MQKLTSNQENRWRSIERGTQRKIAELGEANRPGMKRMMRFRANMDNAVGSEYNYALWVRKADAACGERDFLSLDEDDLLELTQALRHGVKVKSWHIGVQLFRQHLKGLLNVEKLPPNLDRATFVRKPDEESAGQVISDGEFERMLVVASTWGPRRKKNHLGIMLVALLWLLWDLGVRASELLSLRVGSIRKDGQGMWVTLPRDEEGLKTGSRQVYGVLSSAAMNVWLSLHPDGGNPHAPLFLTQWDRSGKHALQYQGLNDLIHDIGDAAGVNVDRLEAITAHDFRHTACTRDGENDMQEQKMRKKYGWSPKSSMPSVYCHLRVEQLKEHALRSAGLTAIGTPVIRQELSDAEQLAAIIARMAQGKALPGTVGVR